MFDFGAGELIVIGVVALVAIGPKELPGLLRTIGQAVGKMRRMAGEFQGQFNEAMREADMADAQKLITDIKTDISGISIEPNPTPTPAYPFSYGSAATSLADVASELSGVSAIEPPASVSLTDLAVDHGADETPEPKKRSRKGKPDVAVEPVIEASEPVESTEEKPKRRKSVKKAESEEEAS
jgi:sec-independent protein translocase protein TatB